ncbi:S9 family peptidase [Flavihumibacter fluvii]|uniref:S9 family peptidase n=1 Tax=Flavihumibacter fluvii TaxID=2838157 RepID=UPI001BDE07A5|nr:S9 family peptidase [Flavihumibacter fluvii]ULQ50890.1 S9 family peptidase [Flavihumibacter fluvii]
MSRFFIFLLFMVVIVPCYAQAKTNWSPEQSLRMKNISAVVPSPDGTKVLYSVREAVMTVDRSEYINQVYVANADGSNTIQLTQGEKNSGAPQWSPDGQWISFTSDRDGKSNLYIMPVNGGEPRKITDVKKSVDAYKWSYDGSRIAFIQVDAATDDDEKNKKAKNDWYFLDEDYKQSRLYLVWLNENDSTGKNKWKKLTSEYHNVNAFDWSPDGKNIVYSHGKSQKVNDNYYGDISVVDVVTGKSTLLVNTEASESNPLYSPDGKQIVYYSSAIPVDWSGPKHAQVYSFADKKTWRLAATPNEDGIILGWAADGQSILWLEASKTLNSIFQIGIDGKTVKLWSDGQGNLVTTGSINISRTHWGFVSQNTRQPGEAYISGLPSFTPQKVSAIHSGLAGLPVPKTEIVKWKAADGKEIEGLLTYPLNYETGKKYPLILNVHGGPAGVFQQTFIAGNQGTYPIAAFAEKGVFVLRPNPRGSSGYGTAFRTANRRDWGGADYKDLMLGVDYVLKMGVADADRLGVMGWSYGGFMSSWIVGHTDRFKAASIGAPVVDLSFQNLTDDIAGFLPSYMKSEPWNDWAVYDAHSPLRYVQNVKTPVLLQHCEGDQRVPISNGLMFYNALKRRDVPVRMLAMPRQGHGPVEPRMVLKTMQTNLEWFDKYLADKKAF